MRRVNQSELTTFMRCPRKWDLSYVQGWRSSETNSNLRVGTLVHAGLEAHYTGVPWTAALDAVGLPTTPEEDEVWNSADYDLAKLMLEGYMEWLEDTGADSLLTPEYVERQVEVELPELGVIVHGTLDWTARDQHGQLWLFDHKTVAAFGALVDRRLQLSFQLLTYAWLLWKSTGERPVGVGLNMLRKVKRTAAAKPPFYAREMVQFNEHQLTNHERHLEQVISNLLEAEKQPLFVAYPVPDQDCTWKCPFMQICPMLDDGSDYTGALNDLYVRSDGRSK